MIKDIPLRETRYTSNPRGQENQLEIEPRSQIDAVRGNKSTTDQTPISSIPEGGFVVQKLMIHLPSASWQPLRGHPFWEGKGKTTA
ncbi:Dpse\GA12391-PA-like protein [Anopheles sinensis]|uniref:Dpse\GA12391-PA-like protein n=1 Tax=Anopheles sinensis TaxID=74873 RepID=A0A084VS98_ANOSI|nr:Dpse\GA12391-PA-like protein [Anopheles sinensis]